MPMVLHIDGLREIQRVSAKGEAIPALLRQIDQKQLAEEAESLPDLHMRFIEVDVLMRPEGPVLLEGQPNFP